MTNESRITQRKAAKASAAATATTGVADVACTAAVNMSGDSPPPVVGVEAGLPGDLEVYQP